MTKERSCIGDGSDWSNVTGHCPIEWDGIRCWPITEPGSTALLSCYTGMKATVTRRCMASGVWEPSVDYSVCVDAQMMMSDAATDDSVRLEGAALVYVIGYTLSVTSLTLATLVCCLFKDLHCVRNSIHINLFITYLTTGVLWMLSLILQLLWTQASNQAVCLIFVALHYTHSATFYWMFVEGHYLYNVVVRALISSPLSFRSYFAIGWGAPLGVIIIWALIKSQFRHGFDSSSSSPADYSSTHRNSGWRQSVTGAEQRFDNLSVGDFEQWLEGSANHSDGDEQWLLVKNFTKLPSGLEEIISGGEMQCPWLRFDTIDWLYVVPCILLLTVNVLYLTRIMMILIAKLSDSRCEQLHLYQRYRKAAKALLVLLPLLGGTYILILISPFQTGAMAVLFEQVQALLISTQGLAVAMALCFFNGEVHNSVLNHYRRWKEQRRFSRILSLQTSRRSEAIELNIDHAELNRSPHN